MSAVEYLSAREIAIREFNSLRGRLCSVIESANLRPQQERAMVNLVKTLSYQNQAVVAELMDKLGGEDKTFSYVHTKLEENG